MPIFVCERFLSGKDDYGAGFTKHNNNYGWLDQRIGRLTPQVFSAFTFYASKGNCLVVDIQGLGDLFTDPQIHSMEGRFGAGDLGCRGMALFFLSFHHCALAEKMALPIFPLSKKETIRQTEASMRNLVIPEGDTVVKPEAPEEMDVENCKTQKRGSHRISVQNGANGKWRPRLPDRSIRAMNSDELFAIHENLTEADREEMRSYITIAVSEPSSEYLTPRRTEQLNHGSVGRPTLVLDEETKRNLCKVSSALVVQRILF